MELDECTAHALGIGKSHGARNLLHRFGTLPQPHTRSFDAQPLNGPGRRFTGLSAERAAELPRAEMHGLGQTLHAQRLGQMIACEGKRQADAVGCRFHLR